MLQDKMISFFGAGSIVESLIRGLTAGGVIRPENMVVTNRADRERLVTLSKRYGVQVELTKSEAAVVADILVVACKPKDVADLLAEIGPVMRPGQLLLSVAAGISTDYLASAVTQGVLVIRAMPNTSAQVGESATAIALGGGATAEARELSLAILGAVGQVVEVQESLIDSVTGLSGSGPAYIYYMIEAMVEAGQGVGLDPAIARQLALQTLKGAAKMLVETGADPAVLRQQVTSPAGTTMAGLQVLEEEGFRQALIRAVARASQRSRELGTAVTPSVRAAGDL